MALAREAFNQRAVELAIPLFQQSDGRVVTTSSPPKPNLDRAQANAHIHETSVVPSDSQHALLQQELAANRVTLLTTAASQLPQGDRAMIRALLQAGEQVEVLFHKQLGVASLGTQIPPQDTLARAVFYRNQGPYCASPALMSNPACTAILPTPPRVSGLYPASAQVGDDWCSAIPREAMDPFHVAVQEGDAMIARPYSEHWSTEMQGIARTLRTAADLAPEDEAALQTYLRAAAAAFETNDWFSADAAWAEMSQDNSRYYLRVGPDETYSDPCSEHASFHMVLARVNPAGLTLQQRLNPIKQAMEEHLAELAGDAYSARTVGFDLPEFIDIMVNRGDSRSASGATIGQSLPNWGPVAEAGGRTVAMTNIGGDADSVSSKHRALSSVFCEATMAAWPEQPEPQLFSTVLHEAAHNLGPSHDYTVGGKTDNEAFGGPLASMLEELKAQTAAMALPVWMVHNGYEDIDTLYPGHVADMGWALGHIASGLTDGAGHPAPYSHLAAIQVGYFIENGGMAFHPDTLAANGEDAGCLSVDADNLPDAIDGLMRQVLHIKSTGDADNARALQGAYTSDDGHFADIRAVVADRFAREPRTTYVYRVEVGN
ncbi:MAG: hypothetical protein ACJAZO_000921 [Myxococcota bacterium]|jgi:hypothetical protein